MSPEEMQEKFIAELPSQEYSEDDLDRLKVEAENFANACRDFIPCSTYTRALDVIIKIVQQAKLCVIEEKKLIEANGES